jgi:hypothetical protein
MLTTLKICAFPPVSIIPFHCWQLFLRSQQQIHTGLLPTDTKCWLVFIHLMASSCEYIQNESWNARLCLNLSTVITIVSTLSFQWANSISMSVWSPRPWTRVASPWIWNLIKSLRVVLLRHLFCNANCKNTSSALVTLTKRLLPYLLTRISIDQLS